MKVYRQHDLVVCLLRVIIYSVHNNIVKSLNKFNVEPNKGALNFSSTLVGIQDQERVAIQEPGHPLLSPWSEKRLEELDELPGRRACDSCTCIYRNGLTW